MNMCLKLGLCLKAPQIETNSVPYFTVELSVDLIAHFNKTCYYLLVYYLFNWSNFEV